MLRCSHGADAQTIVTVFWTHLFRGLEAVKKCKTVYLEAYTSMLLVSKDRLVSSLNLFSLYEATVNQALPCLCRRTSMARTLWWQTESLLRW